MIGDLSYFSNKPSTISFPMLVANVLLTNHRQIVIL